MHRQVASLLSTSSPGRLAILGNALGARGIDIATTGGAEWMHHGPITLMIKEDWGRAEPNPGDQIRGFAEVMAGEQLPWLIFRTVEVELEDKPGSLGAAATALDDINIYAVTVLESEGSKALVGLGIRPSQVPEAISRLRAANLKAKRRRHPEDADHAHDVEQEGWLDDWDARTERLLQWFDDHPDTSPTDPIFYELDQTAG